MTKMVRRILAGLAGLVVLSLLTGVAYQWFGTRQDLARHPMPGRLIDVGGHRLHIWCEGSGSPTVILESGLGGSTTDWGFVQPDVSRFTRVCAYDRAGLGYSDAGPSPRTTGRIVRELMTLLERAGISSPVVVAAASLGGFSARLFASEHADRVAGLVLIDASHEDQEMDMPPIARFVPLLAPLGVFRLLGISFTWDPDQLAPGVRDFARAARFRTTVYTASAGELRQVRESAAQVKGSRRTLSAPVVVLTGAHGNSGRWAELQRDQLRLSQASCQIIAAHSGHAIPIQQPEAVVLAIRRVVDAAREHKPPVCG